MAAAGGRLQLGELHARRHGGRLRPGCSTSSGSRRRTWSGASQGGMIAQTLAIEHPERVLSLTSIMSTTGDPSVGQPHPEALPALLTSPPADREGFVEFVGRAWGVIGSPGFDAGRGRAARAARRAATTAGIYPDGTARQLVAILASGDRTAALRDVDVPDGGDPRRGRPADRRLRRQGHRRGDPGRGARADPGMGHDLPRALWPRFVDADRGQRGAGGSRGRRSRGGAAERLRAAGPVRASRGAGVATRRPFRSAA